MSNAQQVERVEAVREGSRWIYSRPNADQVREWFDTQAIYPGLTHEPYLSGVVIISSTEKIKETRRRTTDGGYFTVELDMPTFTPYVKVDTRVSYFWDLVRKMNEGEDDKYIGTIRPVSQQRFDDTASPYFNGNLPEGFSWFLVKDSKDQVARYLVAETEVAIYRREDYAKVLKGEQSVPVLYGRDTKQTAILSRRGWPDDFAIMKARTGSIGRALGVAGILVVGTGVASAEDMEEIGTAQAGTTDDKPVTLPAIQGADADRTAGQPATQQPAPMVEREVPQEEVDAGLRDRAKALRETMQSLHPNAWKAYVEWYTEERRFPPLDELTGSALKGAVTKLERDLDASQQA